MKIIDLSKPIQYNRGDPRFMQVRVKHKRRGTAKMLVWLLGLPRRLFPKDFSGWADDTITRMGVHSTTAHRCALALRAALRRQAGADDRGHPAGKMHRPRRRARSHAQGG